MSEITTDQAKLVQEHNAREREIEKNKREAIEVAAGIFKIISDPSIVKITTADERHKMCIEKNKNFAQAFPLVLSKMSRDLAYNESAFRKFLDKLHRDPGQGMDGVIERQADYAMYLYQEQCKSNGRHYNQKIAKQIRSFELQHMSRWAKDIKKKETSAKSEYAEENKRSLDERKKELLDFVTQLPAEAGGKTLDEIMQQDQDYMEMLRTTNEPLDEPLDKPHGVNLNPDFDGDENPPPSGYTEQQTPVASNLEQDFHVRAALQVRADADAVQCQQDWIKDSNIAAWRKKITRKH